MGKKKREAVVFLNEHMEMASELLTERERGRVFEAVRRYSIDGQLPDLTKEKGTYRTVFKMMKNSQDKYIESYEKTCERNKANIHKRWGSGGMEATHDGHTSCTTGTSGISGKSSYTRNTNTIQSNSKQYNTTQSDGFADYSSLEEQETGVPGIGWL